MASATDGLQYVKWAALIFFSIEVAKLHTPKKVLNQKGLFDFASVERTAKPLSRAPFLKKALAAALHIARRCRYCLSIEGHGPTAAKPSQNGRFVATE